MHKTEQHIEAVLKKHPASKYIVACSAGLDSTVLLHILKRLGKPVLIAHVNYHLRGDDSNEDQLFLENLAKELNVEIVVKSVELENELKDGGNLQQLAREIRYDFFEELLSTHPKSRVLLAHHREDQTETFFINLSRDSGVMGLSSMPEKRDNFIRPMLSLSKSDLRAYAKDNRIEWREDVSNQSEKYTRNVWRNSMLPGLRQEIPDLDESVQTLVSEFQELQRQLEEKVAPIVNEILKSASLDKDVFDKLSSHEKVELCRQIGQSHKILNTWEKLNLKGTKVKLQPNKNFRFNSVVFDNDRYSFIAEQLDFVPELKIENCQKLPESYSKSTIYLDRNKIQGALTVRKPATGDRIHPIGMNGSKLVSDVISDGKLTAIEKQEVFVVTDANNILWIPGLCVSRKAIAHLESNDIIEVSLLV